MRKANPSGKELESSTPGSLPSSEPDYLVAGRLHRPHGIHGEIELEIITGFPERLRPGVTVFLGDLRTPVKIVHRRSKDQKLLLTFDGNLSREEVGQFRNQLVYVKGRGLPKLPEGEYYHHELLGMKVFDEYGKHLGTLDEILETGANDVYLVNSPDSRELLVPAIAEVILTIDQEQRKMVIRPQSWD